MKDFSATAVLLRLTLLLIVTPFFTQCSAPPQRDYRTRVLSDAAEIQVELPKSQATIQNLTRMGDPEINAIVADLLPRKISTDARVLAWWKQREQIAHTMPPGIPLSMSMLKDDPTLQKHRAWLAASQRLAKLDQGHAALLAKEYRAHAAHINRRWSEAGGRVLADDVDATAAEYERAQRSSPQIQTTLAALGTVLDYLKATQGRWTAIGGDIIFLRDSELARYQQLLVAYRQTALKTRETLAPPQ
jgi:hypothetical protein